MNNFKKWLCDNFSIAEIAHMQACGCQKSTSKMSTYTETSKIYEEFKEDIFKIIDEWAEVYTDDNIFGLLRHKVHTPQEFEQLMVWTAAEFLTPEIIQDYYSKKNHKKNYWNNNIEIIIPGFCVEIIIRNNND